MADKKISELTSITGADVDDANDTIAIVDSSEGQTKKITRGELFTNVGLTGDVTGDLTGDVTGDLTGDVTGELDLTAIDTTKAETAVDVFVYDTSKDSDGGAWRKRTQHTSWYNETLNTATRGSRREFPAVAVIVAESTKVTIYDGDDPSLPMWMVFGTISNSILRGSANDVSSAVMGQAQLIVGANNLSGLYQIDFLKDHGTRFASAHTTNTGLFHLTIAERSGTAPISIAQSSDVIVNSTVNDVAMTVLPDAPIDPATGLPVPTIAVATDGGVSVIKDDGTVVDLTKIISGSVNSARVVFLKDGGIAWSSRDVSRYIQVLNAIPDADYAGDPDRLYSEGDQPAVGTDLYLLNLYASRHLVDGASGGDDGVTFLDERPDAPEKGMVAYTTSTYNTGWMNGDIKGAFLADTDDTDLVGATLASDDFTSYADEAALIAAGYAFAGTSPVFDAANDQVDYVGSGSLQLQTSAVNAIANGTPVYIQVTVSNRTAGSLNLQNNYVTEGKIGGGGIQSNGTFEYLIVKDGLLRFTSDPTFDGSIDSYVIKLADADRSVNNKGLIVNGTVTRSPVATGAELVAYSGFSASNYLEQPYNSALDFGTGDFCVMGWVELNSTGYGGMFHLSGEKTSTSNPGFCLYYFPTGVGFKVGAQTAQSTVRPSGKTHVCGVRLGTTLFLYVNGSLVGTYPNATNSATPSLGANLLVGGYYQTGVPIVASSNDKFALLRISATAPTAEQIKKIYEDEKVLFQENAACTLYGASDAVTALAHDEDTGLLHVGTSAGRSVFQGLRRVSNTTTAVGTAISASGGMVVEE